MAPKAMTYKPNSVIYFKGDNSDRIYILKSGKISLQTEDIETGQEVRDYIQTGEFFGVKSALGKYPREENALVMTEAAVVSFSVQEFEQLAVQNTRIIMKMLKVFSNQLRWIHKRVQNLLATEEQIDPETGLYNIGEYYLRKKMYVQALHVFRRYLKYYPAGKFASEASSKSSTAESYAQRFGQGRGSTAPPATEPPREERSSPVLSDVANNYYEAVSLFSQADYAGALKAFKQVADSGDEEYEAKSQFEIGRCLFQLKQYDSCIRHFTGFIQTYPKFPDLGDVLFYIGQSCEAKNDRGKALGFYKKIIQMPDGDSNVIRKAQKAIRALEERVS